MTPADITALRIKLSKVFAELGMALACIEDVEGLSNADGLAALNTQGATGIAASTACSALACERMEGACNSLETAAAHLAEVVTTADQLALKLAPQGVH